MLATGSDRTGPAAAGQCVYLYRSAAAGGEALTQLATAAIAPSPNSAIVRQDKIVKKSRGNCYRCASIREWIDCCGRAAIGSGAVAELATATVTPRP